MGIRLVTKLFRGDWAIMEKTAIRPGFYQITCTRIFMSKEACWGVIEDIQKGLEMVAQMKKSEQ